VPWLVTVLVGIWKFSAGQAQSNRVPFLTKQLELSFDASDAASSLAVETDPVKWDAARRTFWHLYWGTLSIVEDKGVETAMVNFGEVVPSNPVSEITLPVVTLHKPSYELAHAIRDLVLKSWNAEYLGGLLNKRIEAKPGATTGGSPPASQMDKLNAAPGATTGRSPPASPMDKLNAR
jgi:hypothetical protein